MCTPLRELVVQVQVQVQVQVLVLALARGPKPTSRPAACFQRSC